MTWICELIMGAGDIGMAAIVIGGALGLLAVLSVLAKWILGDGKEDHHG